MAKFGAICPDGHGPLLSGDSWGDRLYCPSLEHGGNGAFFEWGESGNEPVRVRVQPKSEPLGRRATAQANLEVVKAKYANGTAAAIREAQAARLAKPAKAEPKPRAEKAGRPCQCKCGGTTKGGRFLPGHDARYHAAERRIAAGTGTAADKAMVS